MNDINDISQQQMCALNERLLRDFLHIYAQQQQQQFSHVNILLILRKQIVYR